MNSVILIGRLTRDPELVYTPGNQTAVTHFSIAVDRPTAQGKEKQEDSIVIPKTSTAWDAAQLIINTKCEFKTLYSKNMMNVFDEEEIMALGKHLLSYAEIENELNE